MFLTADMCNKAVKRFPGGIVCICRLASEGVLVIWYRRLNIWPSVRTYYSSVRVHGHTLLLYYLFLSGNNDLLQVNLRAAVSPEEIPPYSSSRRGPPGPWKFQTTELPGLSPRLKIILQELGGL